ncbi:MAG: hypothetical protein Q4F05_16800, partial [bacterium]|nr:hypothetical protein [bacterium]
MNISGTLYYNGNNQPQPGTGIAGVAIALQLQGSRTLTGTVTETGVVTTTNSTGGFTFTDVPAGSYRVVEAAGYTGAITSPGSWIAASQISVTPNDPPISVISSPPTGANELNSLSPNTVFVTVTTADITGIVFYDAPIQVIPLSINNYVTTGGNLVTAADNGTFGTLPNGTAVQTSNANGNPPYTDFTTAFTYVQYVNARPSDGEYTISNTIVNSNFGTWFNISDYNTRDETGRMMIVNGNFPGQSVFAAQVTVSANTDYVFSAWVMNIDSQRGSVLPQLRVQVTGTTVIFDQLLTDELTVTAIPTWKQTGAAFNSGANTTLNVQFISEGGAAGGNDYVIDNITLLELEPTPVTSIQKSVDKTIVNPGDEITYNLTFTNSSSTTTLSSVSIQDVIPQGTTVVPDSVIINGVQREESQLGTGISIDDVAPGGSVNIQFRVTVNSNVANGTILNNSGSATYTYTDATGVTRTVTSTSNEVQTGVLNPTCPTCPTGPTG